MPTSRSTLRLTGRYDGPNADRLLRELEPLRREPAGRWRVDLSAVEFLTPVNVAVAAVAFEHAAAAETDVEVVLPSGDDCRTYVQRIDLLPASWRVPETFGRREAVRFCPARRFSGDADYAAARSDVVRTISRVCTIDRAATAALATCLDELFENVVHHAAAETPAVAVAQAWPKRGILEVAIADAGRGVAESLAGNVRYAGLRGDSVAAVEEAFRVGVTANPAYNAGMGLALARHLLRGNGGTIGVRSGAAAVTRGVGEAAQRRATVFPGTLVVLDIRVARSFDLAGAYASMDEEREPHAN